MGCTQCTAATGDIALTMRRGDSKVFKVIVTDANGARVNLTGYTMWFTAKRTIVDQDVTALIHRTNAANDGIVFTANVGEALVTMDPLQTRGFPDGDVELVCDVQVKSPTGLISTVAFGTLTVKADVTRAIT